MSPIFDLSLTLIMIYFFFWAIRPINFAKFMPYTPVQATFLKVRLFTLKLLYFNYAMGLANSGCSSEMTD